MPLHDPSDTAAPDPAPDAPAHPAIDDQGPRLRGRGSGPVVITVKRRKPWAAQVEDAATAWGARAAATVPQRAPRVFRIDAPDADDAEGAAPRGSAPQAPALDEAAGTAAAEVAAPKPAPRRRPRNPDRAPGKVTTVVQPPAAPASRPDRAVSERAIPYSFDVDVEGYARVMDALRAVQATLQQARRARDFRIR